MLILATAFNLSLDVGARLAEKIILIIFVTLLTALLPLRLSLQGLWRLRGVLIISALRLDGAPGLTSCGGWRDSALFEFFHSILIRLLPLDVVFLFISWLLQVTLPSLA